ncbi:peptidase S1 and S6 chymotrypsin/Hap [Chthoniobacter flavus Ellin428]|uniref:Peptidase S1 and S6 chymotrypsin/Hap n=1 Tax=Chthoniobacter flavus Ellin428 TaxID=497964 RepID=B4D191_9BACT|nr:VPAMP-CTERM sorting domain-containing protein [Chthoniobacter flavus]EDY19783.1 peptidase S1 and S6 chymotrypsin/Hap [Chthoniobacter flavus Ellin428]TCO91943.1 putative secreted protein with VPAMP-CTERM motif [Chthoniobacter flavus]
MKIRALQFFVFGLVALARPALGVIVINSDESANRVTPTNGAPWQYVARLDDHFGARASGVYLGNRYVLTANHVDNDMNNVFLNGVNYAVDTTFIPVAITNADLRIIRIVSDPGLPFLHLASTIDNTFNRPATMIGWGVGRGTAIPNQGWNWGDDSTRFERWGTSATLGNYSTDPVSGFTFLMTTFDITFGPQTGQLTGGDSGGGLFENLNGTWTLVGINSDVDTDNEALYDEDPSTPGNQPDHSYFQTVAQYANQIEAIIGPAPVVPAMPRWGYIVLAVLLILIAAPFLPRTPMAPRSR